ncbi:major facilitator superfamily domain-containing protein [Glomus cerebriforme]|uniref:Major facilitator superfamily domain-containing protein n=1 Tax=Glomus cerebriforme TaxID=658196 RepID=A0A397TAR4_9GLOM|nr:major facilitator superfamily domain-containing protein [Glomus cerebriforme]
MNVLQTWQNLYIPKRLIVLGLCALAILVNYADRSNIAVAIVYMAKEFSWSSTTQGLVLSSFFVGYITTQVLGGALADKFGGKWVLGVAAAGWTTFTLLTPSAAKLGLSYLLPCRILLGITEGAGFPSVHSLIASWTPPEERSRAVTIITSSNVIGSVIAFPVSTWLGSTPWGWESIFWVFGAAGVIWSLLWQIYGGSDPSTYPGISNEELDLILKNNQRGRNGSGYSGYSSLPTSEEEEIMDRGSEDVINVTEDSEATQDNINLISGENDDSFTAIKNSHIPWRLILSRREVWAILVAYFCHSWGFFILLTWLPTYYLDHFGVDIKYLGYFTVLPYAVQGISGFFVGILADYIIYRLKVRVIIVRRMAQITGSLSIAVFLLLATYVAKTPLQGIILIAIGTGLDSFTLAGSIVSQLDIAPRYSGVIFGLANSLGTIPAIVGVALTGWILDTTGRNWNIIWSSSAALYFIGAFVFSIWAGEKVIIE